MKRYINTSDETGLSSAMQQLIENCRHELINDMKEQECDTFKEFVELNGWDASDIRGDIEYMVNKMFGGFTYDDGSGVVAPDDTELSYRQFKSLVTKGL